MSTRFPWRPAALLMALVVATYFYQFDEVPARLHHDCGLYLWHAWRIVHGQYQSIFHSGYAEIPLLGHTWTAAWAWVVGTDSMAAIRTPSLVAGLLAIVIAASIAWQLTHRAIAPLVTMVLLGGNGMFLHFARIGAYMDHVPFEALAVAGLIAAGRRWWWSIIAGAACAYATLGYFAGRITPLVCVWVGLILTRQRRLSWTRLLMAGGIACALLAPQILHTGQGWVWNGRLDQFGFMQPPSAHWPGVREGSIRTIEALWRRWDGSSQYGGGPIFGGVEAAALALAAVLAIIDWTLALVVGWAVLLLFIGSALTQDTPFFPRIVAAPVPLCIALGILASRITARWMQAAVLALAFWLSVQQVITYRAWAMHPPTHWLYRVGRNILALPRGQPIVLVDPVPDELVCRHPALAAFIQDRPCSDLAAMPASPTPGSCYFLAERAAYAVQCW
jgi:hypothetical protein